MRGTLFLLLILSGCASDMQGKWPSLATRAGEAAPEVPMPVTGPCAGSGQDMTSSAAAPVVVRPPEPLPADAESRLAAVAGVIAAVEAKAPAEARVTRTAIDAARRNPAQSGDAEVARSRFETLFMPLSIEERRLDVLSDDVVGRAGGDAMLKRIAALRVRLAALQALRVSLPD